MKFFEVPYRWLPRTFFKNIYCIYIDIMYGFKNVYKWLPYIWLDRDYDWAYLTIILEFKLRNMSKLFSDGCHTSSKRDARRMLICAEILKRLRTESYACNNNGLPITRFNCLRDEKVAKYYQKYLGELLGKHLRSWWD